MVEKNKECMEKMKARKQKHRKGVVYVFLVATMGLFIVSLLYTIFSEIYIHNIFPIANETLANYSQTQGTLNTIISVWDAWPLLFIFLLILWAFARSQKKDYDSGGGYQ